MDVALRLVWKVVIEDMRDAVDVDASAGDVGSHQNWNVSFFERREGTGSGSLRFVTVNGSGIDTGLVELFDQTVGSVLGSGEHDATMHLLVDDQIHQSPAFVRLSHKHNMLFNAVNGDRFRAHIHRDNVAEKTSCKGCDGVRHGGTEKQVLALFRKKFQNFLDVMNESHVQHTVGLIEHEKFNG